MTTKAQRTKREPDWPDLVRTAAADDVGRVAEVLASGCDVNQKGGEGMTALMLVAATGQMEVFSLLLARGASIDFAREDGLTALAVAAFFGRHQIVRELIIRGANVSAIGRFRRPLESWADTYGFIPYKEPTAEFPAVQESGEEESSVPKKEEPVSVLTSPSLSSQSSDVHVESVRESEHSKEPANLNNEQPARSRWLQADIADESPLKTSNLHERPASIYESEWFDMSTALAAETEVSPARIWTSDFEEEVSEEKFEDKVSQEPESPAETSGSFGLPSRRDKPDVSPASIWATDYESDPTLESRAVEENHEPVIEQKENSGQHYFVGNASEADINPADDWEQVMGGPSPEFTIDDDDEVTIQSPITREPDTPPIEVMPAREPDYWSPPPIEVVAVEIAPATPWAAAEIAPATPRSAAEPKPKPLHRRALVFDEDGVLPNEASFATVALNKGDFYSYSPKFELISKLSGLRRIGVPALLLVTLGIAATWFEIRYATARSLLTSLNSADATAAAPPKTAIRLKSLPSAERKPVAASESHSGSPIGTKLSDVQPLNPKPAVTTPTSKTAALPAASTSHAAAAEQMKPKSTTVKATADRSSHPMSTARAKTKPYATAATNTNKSDAKPESTISDGSVRPRRVNKDASQSRPIP